MEEEVGFEPTKYQSFEPKINTFNLIESHTNYMNLYIKWTQNGHRFYPIAPYMKEGEVTYGG